MSDRLVLLTQAEERSQAHADTLSQQGVASLIWPLMRVVALETPLTLDNVDALLVTSVNAVELFTARSPHRDLPILCVGETTAAAAVAAGFETVETAGGSAEDLADLAKRRPYGRFLYLRGRDISVDLASAIGGDRVREAIVYETVPTDAPPPDVATAFDNGRFAAVTVWSRRNAETLAEYLADDPARNLAATTLVAISAKAAEPLANAGFGDVQVAGTPDTAMMLDTIVAAVQRFVAEPDCTGAPGPIT